MRHRPATARLLTMLVFASLFFVSPAAVRGQGAMADPAAAPSLGMAAKTPAAIQARLKALPQDETLEAQVKARLTELYTKALELQKSLEDAQARSERFGRLTRDLPEAVKAQQAELAATQADLPLGLDKDATLMSWQQRLTAVEAELAAAQQSLKEWQDEPKRRTDRRAELTRQAEALKTQQTELEKRAETPPAPDEPAEVTAASKLILELRGQALKAEIAAGQAELKSYEAAAELLPLQRDVAARKAAGLEALVKRLRDEVAERRRQETARQAWEARRAAAQAHPALRAIAEQNSELARLRQARATQIEQVVHEVDSVSVRLELLDSQFKKIRKRVDMGQNNTSVGLLLRKQRDELPRIAAERERMDRIAETLGETSLELIDYEDQRNELATLDDRVKGAVEGLGPDLLPEERALFETDVKAMLEAQRTYLDSLISDTNAYLDKLVEQNTHEQSLIDKTREYLAFCNERILWIRSSSPFVLSQVRDVAPALRWLGGPRRWWTVFETIRTDITDNVVAAGLFALVWGGALAFRKRWRQEVTRLGEVAFRGTCQDMTPTIKALVLTIFLASPWPALMAVLGGRLMFAGAADPFVHAVGKGLLHTAGLFFGLELLRQICRPSGLGDAHFGWDSTSLKQVRQGVLSSMLIGLPMAAVILITEFQPDEAIKNSLGRLMFVAVHALLLLPAYRITRLVGGVLSPTYRLEGGTWWTRLGWLWRAGSVAIPLCLIGLAVSGYYYTSVQLAARMLFTAALFMGLVVAYALLLRWSLMAYRALGMKRLQERRAAAQAAGQTGGPVPPNTPVAGNTTLEIKLSDINQQTRQTLQWILLTALMMGVWWIWVSVFPALGALRQVELWTLEATVEGGKTLKTPITLADLILSTAAIALTMVLGRNIPSLLELTVLKRLPLDAGARYATGTVAKYAVTGAGLAIAFGALGLQWSQVQWLVAAISVGLGFGLQEIFANFVSGLVLLFERPIRIGDTVTVGDVTGKVSNIHMRAATITDWDMRELIVPNKEFITTRVINWTLSTTVSRMSINIGVSGSADSDRIRSLLLELAQANLLVLKDPPPHALLDDFRDGVMQYVLRVYMPSRDVYLDLRHSLLTQIAARFQREGIEFAFPQREIHVRNDGSVPPEPPREGRELVLPGTIHKSEGRPIGTG